MKEFVFNTHGNILNGPSHLGINTFFLYELRAKLDREEKFLQEELRYQQFEQFAECILARQVVETQL